MLAVSCGALNVRACLDVFSHCLCEDTNARRIVDQIFALAIVEHSNAVEDMGDSRYRVCQHDLHELLDSYVVSYYRIMIFGL